MTFAKSTPATLAVGQHITIQVAATALAINPKTIRRRIADGTLLAVRVGTRRPGTIRDTRPIRIPVEALAALVEPVTGAGAR